MIGWYGKLIVFCGQFGLYGWMVVPFLSVPLPSCEMPEWWINKNWTVDFVRYVDIIFGIFTWLCANVWNRTMLCFLKTNKLFSQIDCNRACCNGYHIQYSMVGAIKGQKKKAISVDDSYCKWVDLARLHAQSKSQIHGSRFFNYI